MSRKEKMVSIEQAKLASWLAEAREQLIAPDEIRDRFDAVATQQYGANMAQWVPDYDYTHTLLLDALALHLPHTAKLLDLGAGTGRVAQLLLQRFPNAHVTLVDFSAKMLAQAPTKLAVFTDRYTIQIGNFFGDEIDFPAASFDGIVSVFALCHGRSLTEYQKLYTRMGRWLKPGGFFICYDHILGASHALTLLNVIGWHNFMSQSQPPASVEEGIRSTYDEDMPLPLAEHFDLMRTAGFAAVDVLYKRDIFALYAGMMNG